MRPIKSAEWNIQSTVEEGHFDTEERDTERKRGSGTRLWMGKKSLLIGQGCLRIPSYRRGGVGGGITSARVNDSNAFTRRVYVGVGRAWIRN